MQNEEKTGFMDVSILLNVINIYYFISQSAVREKYWLKVRACNEKGTLF